MTQSKTRVSQTGLCLLRNLQHTIEFIDGSYRKHYQRLVRLGLVTERPLKTTWIYSITDLGRRVLRGEA